MNTKETVLEVDIRNHRVYTTNEIYVYEYVINTLPLNAFCALCQGIDICNKIDFSYNKVLVYNLGFEKEIMDRSPYKGIHWIYVPEKKYNFYRVGFYNHILHTEKLSLYVEIGFDKDAEIDAEDELRKTLCGLKELGIVEEDNKLAAYEKVMMSPAYVHINTKSQSLIRKLLQELKAYNAFSIGRYGGWTYCSMEDCMLQGKELVKTMKQCEAQ